jgi:hypothetical protein
MPNPNYVADMDISRFAAIRLPECVTAKEQKELVDLVHAVQKVCCVG